VCVRAYVRVCVREYVCVCIDFIEFHAQLLWNKF